MKTQGQKKIRSKALNIGVFVLMFFIIPFQMFAALTVTQSPKAPVENRFVVGPAKLEAVVPAGQAQVVGIDIENRMGRTAEFDIHFEDFVTDNDSNGVVLLGNQTSSTTLKNLLSVPQEKIVLNQGDRVHVPITITTLGNEDPGGRYGAVVVSSHTVEQNKNSSSVGATVIGQVAVLVFVTIPGEIKSSSSLDSFTISQNQKVFFTAPVQFEMAVKNSGTVHVNPYGGITIRNMFGQQVATISIDPWFVLPGSVRTRDVLFPQKDLFGWYTATLELNRGYNDVIDTKSVSFFAFSPFTLVLLFVVLGVLGYGLKRKLGQKNNHAA
jgi:hypothetical protein